MKLPSAPPILQCQRLLLRALTLEDAEPVQLLASAREIADTTLTIPHPYEAGTAKSWVGSRLRLFQAGRCLEFAMVLRDSQTICGVIGLRLSQQHEAAELGYWVGVPFWRQGYCTEAARAVLDWAFISVGLHRVCAHHFTRNPASGRVLQKLGFRHEGTLRESIRKWDRFEDIEVYGLLRSEWTRPAGPVEAG